MPQMQESGGYNAALYENHGACWVDAVGRRCSCQGVGKMVKRKMMHGLDLVEQKVCV